MNELMLKALDGPGGSPSPSRTVSCIGSSDVCVAHGSCKRDARYFGAVLVGSPLEDPYMQRMSSALATTSKVAVSFAIVLGVAPLLFVQVIYDPFWYTSNVISAWWVLIFLGLLIIGYLALYRVYGLNHTYATDGTPLPHQGEMRGVFWLAGAFVIMIACGVIMHAVSNQALFPQEWVTVVCPRRKSGSVRAFVALCARASRALFPAVVVAGDGSVALRHASLSAVLWRNRL